MGAGLGPGWRGLGLCSIPCEAHGPGAKNRLGKCLFLAYERAVATTPISKTKRKGSINSWTRRADPGRVNAQPTPGTAHVTRVSRYVCTQHCSGNTPSPPTVTRTASQRRLRGRRRAGKGSIYTDMTFKPRQTSLHSQNGGSLCWGGFPGKGHLLGCWKCSQTGGGHVGIYATAH